MGLTKSEIATLLGLVASFDQRTVGEADVEAWHAVAEEARWPTFDVVRRAVVKHHATSTERIKPAHISATVREVRRDAYGTFIRRPAPTDMPSEERDDWEQAQRDEHAVRYMARWATGEKLERARRVEWE